MIEIRKADIKWWWQIYKNYRKDFPRAERMSFWLLLLINWRKKGEFLIFTEENGSLAGYAVVNMSKNYSWVLINYLAVVEDKRSKGYGSQMMALLIDYFKDWEGLLLEIEKVGAGRSERENELRKRRKDFYLKNNIYSSRAEIKIRGVLMELMYYGKEKKNRKELLEIHQQIYVGIIGKRRLRKYITY